MENRMDRFRPEDQIKMGLLLNMAIVEKGKKDCEDLRSKLEGIKYLMNLTNGDNVKKVSPLVNDSLKSIIHLAEQVDRHFKAIFTMEDISDDTQEEDGEDETQDIPFDLDEDVN